MTTRPGRVLRKARRVEVDQLDVRFNSELGELKRTRDETYAVANRTYSEQVKQAKDNRATLRREADKQYESGRAELLKRLSKETAEA